MPISVTIRVLCGRRIPLFCNSTETVLLSLHDHPIHAVGQQHVTCLLSAWFICCFWYHWPYHSVGALVSVVWSSKLTCQRRSSDANQILKSLHWLKVPDRTEYKVISVIFCATLPPWSYYHSISPIHKVFIIGHSPSPTSSVKSQDHETLFPACSSSVVE